MTPLSKILIFMKIGMLILFFLVIIIIILSAPSFSASTSLHSIQEQEAEALLKWKDSLDDSNHTRSLLSSWKLLPRSSNFSGNFHSHCKWVGITCDELGSVIHIKLNDSSLRGTLQNFRFSSFRNLLTFVLYNNSLCGSIPSHISNLSRLTYLDLSDNQLSGNIPSEIGLLASLQCLYLYENHLTGSIPASIGNLSKLITLDLTGNKITGSIPREIEKLKSLAELYMYINHLTGSIPPSIGNLSMLTTLGLGQNNITGFIPHEIEQLKSIKVLDLYDNYLSGSIPASIGNLRSLTALSLFDNNLTGSIPLEMNNLTDLETLQFSDNFLSGYLPENVCLGGRLKWFVAEYNAFRGSIPKSLRNCSTLLQLSLSMNLLTGNISKELGIYPRLDYMDLSNNKFVGKLTGNWSQYHNLTMLNFSNNKISGRLPPELGKAAQLRKLDLSSNLLVGNIPKELGLLKHLYFLKLNHNALSGKVPREMGMLFDLEQLDIAENKLNGLIPIHLGQCSKLQYLNLRDNRFNGSVPFQIGNLQTLRGLDLSQNFLTGDLPMELGYLRMLETLNLSRNKFTGSVPSTFKDMLSLTSVDMSYNQLQGPLPSNKAFTMATLGNNKGLCGNNTSLKPCPTPKNGKGHGLAILIIVSVFGTLGLLFIIVGILFCCKHIERNVEEPTETQNETFFSTWNHDGKKVHEEIVKATENFSSKYCIGVGGFGSVFKALLSTGQVVAVKKFHENGGEASKKAFTSEISVLTIARHRNIIKLYGYCSHVRHTFLVYELMEKGSLANMLSDKVRAIELEWSKRVNVVKGLANALFYLHHECSPAIIHRDISSNNVLLDEQYEAHLADFGTGRTLVHESSSNWSSFAGTFGYSAPELAYATPANEKCDVYSFGVITLEVIMGKHPGDLISSMLTSSLPENFHQILLKDVLDQRLLPPKNQIAEEVVSVAMLAFACLLRTPQSRPDMKQVSRKLSTSITSSSNPLSTISLAQILNPQHIYNL